MNRVKQWADASPQDIDCMLALFRELREADQKVRDHASREWEYMQTRGKELPQGTQVPTDLEGVFQATKRMHEIERRMVAFLDEFEGVPKT